ncbi:MAG: hypoxanthine phosphoribosyltransferase [Acidobacteria bacterium]|nr:hypoxanthine phosphoribosyltransferase [Acidobacteriota bacterium]
MAPAAAPHTLLFSADQIRYRVREIATAIENDAPPGETVHLVGVLTGGFVFLADLVRALSRPVTVDFVRCSSYGNRTVTSGEVLWSLVPRDVHGRYVVVVDDIVDSGLTLRAIRNHLEDQQPVRLRAACLLDKPARRRCHVPVEFVGFSVDDIFVVGYGLDHAEQYRHLPYIARLDDNQPTAGDLPTDAATDRGQN